VNVAIFVYEGVSAVEALGPREVLRRLPGTQFSLVAEDPGAGPFRAHSPPLALDATHALEQVTAADLVVVPGGFGCRQLVDHSAVLAWLRDIHGNSECTLAISTGSVVLAAAGLLVGTPATTHWLARDLLAGYGAKPVLDRIVENGSTITALGAAGALEASLRLAARYAGDAAARAIQSELEFDPDAPFDPDASRRVADTVKAWKRGMDGGANASRPWWRRSRAPRAPKPRREPRRIIINPAS
jgi:putative intracellular protease/amidase